MLRRILLGSAALGLVAVAVSVGGTDSQAATSNATLSVTASVASSCTLAATAVAFGTLSSSLATTPVNATGTITVNCTPGAALSISLNGGSNATGGQRSLANGASKVTYNLTQPTAAGNAISSPAVSWGDGGATATGTAFSTTGTGANQVLNVYGTIPAQATSLAAGTYSDAVTVTLTY